MNALPATAVLFTMLTVAAISDIRERRVPNWLNATMLVVGLLAARPWSVTLDHPGVGIAGVTVGMAIWFQCICCDWSGRVTSNSSPPAARGSVHLAPFPLPFGLPWLAVCSVSSGSLRGRVPGAP